MNIKKLFLGFAFFVCPLCAFSEQEEKPFLVTEFCKNYSNNSSFFDDFFEKIIKKREPRASLMHLLKSGKADGCQQALSDYFTQFLENTDKDLAEDKKFEGFLLLAMAVNNPQATSLLKREIDKGRLLEWLDVFEKSDKNSYFKTLSHWVERVAFLLRKLDHSPVQSADLYGKNGNLGDQISPPEAVPIWNPLLINKYFMHVKNEKVRLSVKEFSDLNIIYAASNQSYREIFLPHMRDSVTLNETDWITSFRTEPVWVQFRLFPIMSRLNDGLVKRELIWLAKYHENFKLRSLAQSTLDNINQGFKRQP